jgi:TonB family protein
VLAGEELSFELPQEPSAITIYRPVKNAADPTEKQKIGRMYGAYGAGVVYLILSFDNLGGAEDLGVFVKEMSQYPINGRPQTFERDLLLGGFHGKQYSFTSAVLSGLVQIYKGKSHVYVVEATSEEMSKPDIKRFFGSLSFAARVANYDPNKEALPKEAPPKETPAKTPTTSATPSAEGVGMGVGPGTGAGPGPGTSADLGRGTSADLGRGVRANPDAPIVMSGKDVSRKAILVAKPEPGYTEEARRNQVTGTVVLRCVFASSGRVERITAVKPLPFGLTEKAIMAAKSIRFIPALKDGRYVSQYMQLEYSFNLY